MNDEKTKIGYIFNTDNKLAADYKIGKTYRLVGELNKFGFQYAANIETVAKLCNMEYAPIIKEVQIIGNTILVNTASGDAISATNALKVIRDVPISEHKLFELDDRFNVIKFVDAYDGIYEREYDANDNLVKEITPEGDIIIREYNAENKLTKVIWGDENYATYTYEKQKVTVYIFENGKEPRLEKVVTYNENGYITAVNNGGINEVEYTYNDKNKIIRKVTNLDNKIQEIIFEYNENDRLNKILKNNVVAATFEYDTNGHTIHEYNISDGDVYKTYDDNGFVTSVKRGNVLTTYNHDDATNTTTVTVEENV